jgi:hypothetical protein
MLVGGFATWIDAIRTSKWPHRNVGDLQPSALTHCAVIALVIQFTFQTVDSAGALYPKD